MFVLLIALGGHLAVRRPKAAAVGSVAAVATAFVDDIHVYPRGSVGDAVQSAGQLVFLFAVAWVFGGVYRKRREYLEALHEQTAARVVMTERLRIARELHDSVAHSIGIITVLSGAAARVVETKPEQTRQALTGIETTSRETLLELQRMLGALRRAEPDDAMPQAAPLAPAGSLADVPQLAERTADAGVRVHVTWRGEQRPLPPEIELSAFRIIQESVTNVVRHSGARACRVAVGYEPKGVTIEVVDDGDDGLRRAGPSEALGGGRRERLRPARHARAGDVAVRPVQRGPASGGRIPGGGEAPGMSVRVLLVDDQPLMLVGLGILIGDTVDLEVVGQAGDGREAVRLVRELRPDVVVMDIRMPGMDGIEATRQATAEPDPPKVLVLTTFDDDEYVYGALRAGASGFLLKSMALDAILDAIRVVAAGDALIAPSVTRRLIADFAGTSGPAAPGPDAEPAADSSLIPGITDREREVLALVGQGLSNAEIAERLVISAATAKTHVARLFAKLEARDRVHLAIIAFETGLVPRRR